MIAWHEASRDLVTSLLHIMLRGIIRCLVNNWGHNNKCLVRNMSAVKVVGVPYISLEKTEQNIIFVWINYHNVYSTWKAQAASERTSVDWDAAREAILQSYNKATSYRRNMWSSEGWCLNLRGATGHQAQTLQHWLLETSWIESTSLVHDPEPDLLDINPGFLYDPDWFVSPETRVWRTKASLGQLSPTNDAAERALGLMTRYNTRITHEDSFQDMMQVVEHHARTYYMKTKKDLKCFY